jgi:hypothetical protein
MMTKKKSIADGISLNTPVLILLFNRPGATKILYERIRQVKPKFLYIACDGPRESVLGEALIVECVRDLSLSLIDWDCEVKTLFRDDNLGCKYAVDGAVKWFFEHEKEGIILEDDVIPSKEFFFLMEEMLEKNRDNKNISSLSGRCEGFHREHQNLSEPFLSAKFWCWGWASWRDRISVLDVEEGYSKSSLKEIFSISYGLFDFLHVRSMQINMRLGVVNSWAWSYDLGFRKRKMKSLVLPFNAIENVGLDGGTHAGSFKADHVKVKLGNPGLKYPKEYYFDKCHVARVMVERRGGSKWKALLALLFNCFPRTKMGIKNHFYRPRASRFR